MSKWLVTLTYNREKQSGGNGAKYIPAVTVNYQYSNNCFVKFDGEYPTEIEINRLIEKHTREVSNSNWEECEIEKIIPIITFMQKLGEVEE